MSHSLESLKNTSPTFFLAKASFLPSDRIRGIQNMRYADDKIDSIETRSLHALQFVIHLISLPILLLSGVLEAAFRAIICQFKKATALLLLTEMVLMSHICGIPVALTGAFITPPLAYKLEKAMEPCVNTLGDLLTCGVKI